MLEQLRGVQETRFALAKTPGPGLVRQLTPDRVMGPRHIEQISGFLSGQFRMDRYHADGITVRQFGQDIQEQTQHLDALCFKPSGEKCCQGALALNGRLDLLRGGKGYVGECGVGRTDLLSGPLRAAGTSKLAPGR